MESSERQHEESDKRNKSSRYHISRKRGRPSLAESNNTPKMFKCGCGKEYSTNGALFSHTRIKHGGVQPPGSTRMRNNNRKPRKDCGISRKIKTEKGGRKRENGIVMSAWEVDLLALLNSTVGGRDQSLERSVAEVINLVESNPPPLPQVPESIVIKSTFLQLQNQLATMVEGGLAQKELEKETPSDIFERDLWRVINHFKQKGWKLNIYHSICLFLYSVCRFASLGFLTEIMSLMAILLNFINTEGGKEVAVQILKVSPQKQDHKDYCESNDSEYLPELTAAFVKYRYTSKLAVFGSFEDDKSTVCNLFGRSPTHLLRVMHLFCLMMNWLNLHELSNCEWAVDDLPKLDHPYLLEPNSRPPEESQDQSKIEEEEVYVDDDEEEQPVSNKQMIKISKDSPAGGDSRGEPTDCQTIISADEDFEEPEHEPKDPGIKKLGEEIDEYLHLARDESRHKKTHDYSFEEGILQAMD